jgi:uncharacterized membrane protein YoaK (UPF0700 family)
MLTMASAGFSSLGTTPSITPSAAAPFRPALPVLLSVTGGYVDTAGYLALQGLFTAHVTGNFVTLGATLVLGTTGALAKVMALPMFCVIVVAARLAGSALRARGRRPLITLLSVELALLILAFALAVVLGPFRNGDSWQAVATGMTLVSAMAIQNAVHRVHLAAAPPTTIMTGTTTQLMIDIADVLHGEVQGRAATMKRLKSLATSVGAFAVGCACAALLYARVNVWCFAVPPLLAAVGVTLARARKAGPL